MALIQITAPSSEPVTLGEVKGHLRIDSTSEDELLKSYVKSARHKAELYMKRQIMPATWQLLLDCFPGSTLAIDLLRPPLSTASTDIVITYKNSTYGTSTLTSTAYTIDFDSEPGRIYPSQNSSNTNTWPSDLLITTHAVTIQYKSGYLRRNVVPQPIKQWIMSEVGAMYEYREPITIDRINTLDHRFIDGLLDEYILIDV
ncbi:MAG: hypothetical protein GY782_08455 [Gammaproteobacteria bacterium]|nr:hypothetical protein [Gammaproteobacteria bacterium]